MTQWRVRSRVYRWYAAVRHIDLAISSEEPNLASLRSRLHALECDVASVSVPFAYTGEQYHLRLHIHLLQEELDRLVQRRCDAKERKEQRNQGQKEHLEAIEDHCRSVGQPSIQERRPISDIAACVLVHRKIDKIARRELSCLLKEAASLVNTGGRIEQRRDKSGMEIPPRGETRGRRDESRVTRRDFAPKVQYAFVDGDGSKKRKYTPISAGSFKVQELELWLVFGQSLHVVAVLVQVWMIVTSLWMIRKDDVIGGRTRRSRELAEAQVRQGASSP